MNKLIVILALLSTIASAQAAAPASTNAKPTLTVAQILDRQLTNRENEVVPAADAMPEDKFNFAPGDKIKDGEFKGVKTYAQQVRHIAATNELIAASLL